jgi:GrpB-like predicted nucleotidyltransferase (UPF0157 family)
MLKINVVPYDPFWPAHFLRLRHELAHILSPIPILNIHHVGSTSIPLLSAKPIIDIDIVVPLPSLLPAITLLCASNYTFNPEPLRIGLHRLSFRWKGHTHDQGASRPTEDGEVRRMVYLNVPGGEQLLNHLNVRAVLRRDAVLREEYAAVKIGLAEKTFEDIGAYGAAKAEVLVRILEAVEVGEAEVGDGEEAEAEAEVVVAGSVRAEWLVEVWGGMKRYSLSRLERYCIRCMEMVLGREEIWFLMTLNNHLSDMRIKGPETEKERERGRERQTETERKKELKSGKEGARKREGRG